MALRATENGAPKLPPFHDPMFAVAMRLTAAPDADHEQLLRKYAADMQASQWHFEWLQEMSPRLYLSMDPFVAHCWLLCEEARLGSVEVKVRDTQNGIIYLYAGQKGVERKTQASNANGRVVHFEGEKGVEQKVRMVLPSGDVIHYEGDNGAEHKVRLVKANGDVLHFEGGTGEERWVRTVGADGDVEHYEGERGEERTVRLVRADGDVEHLEGDKGEERLVVSAPMETSPITRARRALSTRFAWWEPMETSNITKATRAPSGQCVGCSPVDVRCPSLRGQEGRRKVVRSSLAMEMLITSRAGRMWNEGVRC